MADQIKNRPYHFVIGVDGQRKRNGCYSSAEEAESKRQPGERVEEPRCCPYPGCPCGPDARPPCGLCYE